MTGVQFYFFNAKEISEVFCKSRETKKIEQNPKKTEKIVRKKFMTIIVKNVDNHNMLWYSKHKKHKTVSSVPFM